MCKTDLADGQLPSRLFGTNAASWALMILAHDLNTAMKRLSGKAWLTKGMKVLRFRLTGLPGRLVSQARKLIIRLGAGAEALGGVFTTAVFGVDSTISRRVIRNLSKSVFRARIREDGLNGDATTEVFEVGGRMEASPKP
jgi:hypothetical protein